MADRDRSSDTLATSESSLLKGKRDRALLATLLGCGLRRRELAELDFGHLQRRDEHWAIVDLIGKGEHIRTVPVPDWVKRVIEMRGPVRLTSPREGCSAASKAGKAWGDSITENAVWHIVKEHAAKLGIAKLAPHDLRRSCARLCYIAGGELEKIQFLLGHVSVQTTEKYLCCKQRFQ